MSGYSAFGPRGAATSYQDASVSLADYGFLPPQEEEDEGGETFHRVTSNDVPVEIKEPQEPPKRGAEGGRKSQMEEQQQQQKRSRQMPQRADFKTEKDRIRAAAVELLPMIFASPPSIPAALKSSELNQRHTLLRISPHDLDDYLVTEGPTSRPDTSTRVIQGLEQLKGHIEQLAAIHSAPQDALASIVRDIRWQVPEEGTLLASLGLSYGDAGGNSLAMILKREEVDDEIGWRFHNLLPFEAAPGRWQSDLDAALLRSQGKAPANAQQAEGLVEALLLPQKDREEVQPIPRGATFGAASKTAASYPAVPGHRNCDFVAPAENEEAWEGEDRKGQDLYTNAEDFWGGWEGDDGGGGVGAGGAGIVAAEDDDDEEDDYWNSYGTQGGPDDGSQTGRPNDDAASTGRTVTGLPEAPALLPALANVGKNPDQAAASIITRPDTEAEAIEQPRPGPTSHRARRDGHARGLLRSLVGLVQEGPEPVSEDEFLRWAREAFRKNELERGRGRASEAAGGRG